MSGCVAKGGDGKVVTRVSLEDSVRCELCGTIVSWDYVDHPLFGFAASCPKPKDADE